MGSFYFNAGIPPVTSMSGVVMQVGPSLFPMRSHNHDACISDGLARAEEVCRDRRERLTKNRRAVLELMLASHQSIGAYDIVEWFDWQGRRPAPARIYRALSFLEARGLAHRIVSRNAYIACNGSGDGQGVVFRICEECGMAAEPNVALLGRAVLDLAAATGFELNSHFLKATGRCPSCVRGGEA